MNTIPISPYTLSAVQVSLPNDRHHRSYFIGIGAFVADIAFYLVTFYGGLWLDNWLLKILLAMVNALAISRLFIIGHDACHGSLTDSKKLNPWIGRIAFLVSWTPFTTWDLSHNRQHHVWTNLKQRDTVYPPFSKSEFDNLPKHLQWRARFYRSFWGLPFYYLDTVWWQHIIFPDRQIYPQINDRSFLLDKIAITSFAIFQFVSFFWLAIIFKPATSPYLLTLFAVLVPFYFWNFTMTFVTYQHHTHPKVGWYNNPEEWTLVAGSLYGTIHVVFPKWIRWIMHDIFEHTTHHIDPKVPFYNLDKAQQQLEQKFPEAIVVYPFRFRDFFRVLRTCKLYDYQNHCWTDFDGNPTAPPIPKFRDDKIIRLTGNP